MQRRGTTAASRSARQGTAPSSSVCQGGDHGNNDVFPACCSVGPMWFFIALRHVLSVTPRARRVFSGVRGNNADCRIISVVGLGSRLSPLPLVCDGLLVPQSLSLLGGWHCGAQPAHPGGAGWQTRTGHTHANSAPRIGCRGGGSSLTSRRQPMPQLQTLGTYRWRSTRCPALEVGHHDERYEVRRPSRLHRYGQAVRGVCAKVRV